MSLYATKCRHRLSRGNFLGPQILERELQQCDSFLFKITP